MKKGKPSKATVVSASLVTPNMQQIVFQSESFADFPDECEGGYIKLMFNKEGGVDLSSLEEGSRPFMRTYTIKKFNKAEKSIEVQFVRHITESPEGGFACNWAFEAQKGDSISIAGPGIIQGLNHDADWFFLVADMTALPAMSVKLKNLPAGAKGYAVVEVNSADDKQTLEAPEGIEIEWLIKDDESAIADVAKGKKWLDGEASVWSACEFDSMRSLREYFRNERDVQRGNSYISSYWKNGVTEDGHKVIKRKDAEEQESGNQGLS
ncbi:siderophore-interacting protein [Vibrio sp. JC009]|uniref:siderophore-interacting protein n=1 Tax=Vibrio sp. JC009 TaxID=2912314 RepID=UPI0023B0991E|nr:siderophore-interacting protein [Vibrio sp. JC009]WED22545.1 siderophore-interacting protein [Vibrio sp. JC009]